MDPNVHKRVGYITELEGFGLPASTFAKDLIVSVPYNNEEKKYAGMTLEPAASPSSPKITKVVGVLTNFEWNGAVGDSLKFTFYCSQQNAFQIKAIQQQALKTTTVKKLGWWICDYDQEQKRWFEQSYPSSDKEITGLITGKDNPELDVDLNAEVVKDGIDVNVYKITMGVAPAANKAYALHFANSAAMNVAKAWGLKVGDLSEKAFA
jgi:hypothetical protein